MSLKIDKGYIVSQTFLGGIEAKSMKIAGPQ